MRPLCGPSGIVAGPDNALWFTETRPPCNAIGTITTDGRIREYSLNRYKIGDQGIRAPGKILIGPDGAMWFTVSRALGRITTAGQITIHPIPGTNFYPTDLTNGPDGALWFIGFDNSGFTREIGRMTTNGAVQLHQLDSVAHQGYPSGIASANGSLWILYANLVLRYSLNGKTKQIWVPETGNAQTPGLGGSIASRPDGEIWFTDRHYNRIGRIEQNGALQMFDAAIEMPDPIALGKKGAICFGGFQQVACVSAQRRTITTYWPKSPNSGIWGIALGPDRAIWFTEYYLNAIGKIVP